MSTNSTIIRDGFIRFDKGFCPSKPYQNFFDGLCQRIQVSGCYLNFLQFGLVTFMYFNVGSGRYWKILYYAGLASLFGNLLENGTIAYVCREGDKDTPRYHIVTFFLAEFFWIVKEYSIPFLNLIKMKAFCTNRTTNKIMDYVIFFLFIVFVGCRFYIGYVRMTTGLLSTPRSKYGHTCAFIVMAVADLICTFYILYIVKQHNQKRMVNNNIDQYIRRSSYLVLLFVDGVSIILAIMNSITEIFKATIPSSYANPFQCIKSSFILIMACDAMVFKYGIHYGTTVNKTGNNSNNNAVSGDRYGCFSDTYNNISSAYQNPRSFPDLAQAGSYTKMGDSQSSLYKSNPAIKNSNTYVYKNSSSNLDIPGALRV